MFSAVTLRQNGDQTAQPASLASRGTEPPWAARSSPASQGEGRPLARPNRIHAVAFDREAAGGDLGREAARFDQPPPVERLDRAAPARLAQPDGVDRQLREAVGVDRELRFGRVGLDLDVEPYVRAHCGEELRQRGEAFAVDRLLLGELLRVLGCRIDPADGRSA